MFILSQNWTREAPGQPPSHSRAGWDNSEPRGKGKSLTEVITGKGWKSEVGMGGCRSSFCSSVEEEGASEAGQRWDGLTWRNGDEVYAGMESHEREDPALSTGIIWMAVQGAEEGLGEGPARKVYLSINTLAGLKREGESRFFEESAEEKGRHQGGREGE